MTLTLITVTLCKKISNFFIEGMCKVVTHALHLNVDELNKCIIKYNMYMYNKSASVV